MKSTKSVVSRAQLLFATALGLAAACGSNSTGSPGTSDAGTGCPALAACCPRLPVSENPSECTTVAQTGTTGACSTSLAQYQMDGYCEPSAATQNILCYSPEIVCGWFPASSGCPENPGTMQVSACPAGPDLYGCCVPDATRPQLTICYYGTDAGVRQTSKEECTSTGRPWTTTVPG